MAKQVIYQKKYKNGTTREVMRPESTDPLNMAKTGYYLLAKEEIEKEPAKKDYAADYKSKRDKQNNKTEHIDIDASQRLENDANLNPISTKENLDTSKEASPMEDIK